MEAPRFVVAMTIGMVIGMLVASLQAPSSLVVHQPVTALTKQPNIQIAVGMVLRQREHGGDQTLHFHTSSWLAGYADHMSLAPSASSTLLNDPRIVTLSSECRLCESHPMGPVYGLSCRRWTLLREMYRRHPAASFFLVLSDDVLGNMTALGARLGAYSPLHDLYAGYAAKTAKWPPIPHENMDHQLDAWGLTQLEQMNRTWKVIPHIAGGPGYIFSRHTVGRLLAVFELLDSYDSCTYPDDIWLGSIMGRYLGVRPTNIAGVEQSSFAYNLLSHQVQPCEVNTGGPVTHFFRMYPDDPLQCDDLILMHVGAMCASTGCPLADLRHRVMQLCRAGHRNLMFHKMEQRLDVSPSINPIQEEGRWNNQDVKWQACECITEECCQMYPYMCLDRVVLVQRRRRQQKSPGGDSITGFNRTEHPDMFPSYWADKLNEEMAISAGKHSEQTRDEAYAAVMDVPLLERESKYQELVNKFITPTDLPQTQDESNVALGVTHWADKIFEAMLLAGHNEMESQQAYNAVMGMALPDRKAKYEQLAHKNNLSVFDRD